MLTAKPQQEQFQQLFAAGAEPNNHVQKDAANAHVRRPGLALTAARCVTGKWGGYSMSHYD